MARWETVAGEEWWAAAPAHRALVAGRSPLGARPWEERLAELASYPPERRALVSRLLAAYQEAVDAPAEAVAAARALADPAAVAVTAGQQPGLLYGPLFTVYKAATAVSLARELAARLGRPVVPVFWIVSDDHDWAEAAACALPGRDGRVLRLGLACPAPGRCVGEIPLPPDAPALVEDALAAAAAAGVGVGGAPAAAGAGEVAEFLRASVRASASLGVWFARLLARLFGRQGLVVLDPLAPGWDEACLPFYAPVLADPAAVDRALAAGAARLAAQGLPAALPPGEHAWLFLRAPEGRVGLLWRGGGFSPRRGDRRLTAGELTKAAAAGRVRLSPGAALRPALRDWLLPTAAHVGGPGESAYLAQLDELYRVLGLGRPVLRPRLSVTLVDPEDAAALAAAGLTPAEALGDGEALAAVLARAGGAALEDSFAAARAALAEAHGRLVARLEAAGVKVNDLAAGNLGRMLAQLSYLEEKARQRWRRRPEVAAVVRVLNRLWPEGRPQEQVLNVLPWLLRAGWGLAEELLRLPLTGAHQVAVWEG